MGAIHKFEWETEKFGMYGWLTNANRPIDGVRTRIAAAICGRQQRIRMISGSQKGTRPKLVRQEHCNLRIFHIKRLEFLTQRPSIMCSQAHAYEPGFSGLMLGGKDRLC